MLPLMEIVEVWDNAAHHFVNPELDKARKSLYLSAFNLGTTISKYTVPNRDGYISVIVDRNKGCKIPVSIKMEAQEINSLAKPFVLEHEKFIKLGRKKLY